VAETNHRVLRDRLKGDADEREEIGNGDGAAFFFGWRDVLDERVDGDYEESAEDADEAEVDRQLSGGLADANVRQAKRLRNAAAKA